MTSVPASASATVVLVRDGSRRAIEVLLLRRNARIAFHGGEWVFPGGRVDAADVRGGDPLSIEAGRRAAIRETREEAGLDITAEDLVPIAHWTTPEHMPKRFSTWFFAARAPSVDVSIDRGEITEHRFFSPSAALDARHRGEIGLPPPTFLTLLELAEFGSTSEYLEAARRREPLRFFPRYRDVAGGPCSLLPGDVAYEGGALEADGPRHRMWLPAGGPWRYERTP